MPKLFIRHTEMTRKYEDEAKKTAESILLRVNLDTMLQRPDEATGVLREELQRCIADMVDYAFRRGKLLAYRIIAAIPPKTREKKVEKLLNDKEKELLADTIVMWQYSLAPYGASLASKIAAHRIVLSGRGMSKQNIMEFFKRDWDTKGRLSGEYQRAFVASAASLIGMAEQAGQQSGYLGVGQ